MKLFLLSLMIALNLCPKPIPPSVNMEGLCEVEIVEPAEPIKTVQMVATAYTACVEECGKADGITASGAKVKQGRTVAADWSVLPCGTHIRIDGHEYIVEDCGVKGNVLDIYYEQHSTALAQGVQTVTVEVMKGDKQ